MSEIAETAAVYAQQVMNRDIRIGHLELALRESNAHMELLLSSAASLTTYRLNAQARIDANKALLLAT